MSNPLAYVAPVWADEVADEVEVEVEVAVARLPSNVRAAMAWLAPCSRFIVIKAEHFKKSRCTFKGSWTNK